MRTPRALLLCPGRGSYTRESLGCLQGVRSSTLDALEAVRADAGRTPLRELDAMPAFSGRAHLAGEHASLLTAACTLLDVDAIDPEKVDVVAVCGNSMGWYTALGCAGALTLDDCARLIDTMGAWQAGNVIGGQLIYPLVGDDWRPDAARAAAVQAALAADPELGWSIRLGGQAVLGGSEAAVQRAMAGLPPVQMGSVHYPMRLPWHSAFHTPWMGPTADRAGAALAGLGWRAPHLPLIDGFGRPWRPRWADPAALRDYTLGPQVAQPFDFSAMLTQALGDHGPDLVILPGPGGSLGSAVAQVMIAIGWQGLRSRADFLARQAVDPVLVSMSRPEQRARVARG